MRKFTKNTQSSNATEKWRGGNNFGNQIKATLDKEYYDGKYSKRRERASRMEAL